MASGILYRMKYKAVGFDYGGVINGEPGSVFTKRFCQFVGVSEEGYKKAYFLHNRSFNAGKPITERELWSRVLNELGKSEKLDAVMVFVEDMRVNKSLNQSVLDLVDSIRKKGYKTGLLSNNSVEAAMVMRSTGIDSHFDVFMVSAVIGLMKPDPSLYNLFAKELDIQMSELIFIDDSQRSLSSAQECGYTPIHFTDYENLIASLENLKVI